MMRIGVLKLTAATGIAVAVLALTAVAAVAAPAITVSPMTPFLAGALSAGPPITRSREPQLIVQAAGATSFTCGIDGRSLSCGSPSPSSLCQATLCTTIDLPTLPDGEHLFTVLAVDAQDGSSSRSSFAFDVHARLPETTPGRDDFARPRHPVFGVVASSGDPDVLDAAQCSFTPARARPVWTPCAPDGRHGADAFASRPALPARAIAYRFRARAVDPFGRVDATSVTQLFDPVPCTVTAPGTIALSRLIRGGLPVVVTCTGVHAARLGIYVRGTTGHTRSPDRAARGRRIAELAVRGSGSRFTAHRTLRLARGEASRLSADSRRHRASPVIAVQAIGAYATRQSGLPAYASVTALR